MTLETLSDHELHQSNIRSAARERSASVEMIRHLVETNRRRLYSHFSCSSLHDYCVKHLKMTNGDAWRKISSARLITERPELEPKLERGTLTPTQLAEAAAAFKREDFTPSQKSEILTQMENTSTEVAREIIREASHDPEKHLREHLRKTTKTITEVKVYLDEETMDAIRRLKEIWSHAIPAGDLSKIIKRASLETVEKNDPLKKAERAASRATKNARASTQNDSVPKNNLRQKNLTLKVPNGGPSKTDDACCSKKPDSQTSAPLPGLHSTLSKAFIEHTVRLREKGECTFVDLRTGEQCASKFFLEFDHVIPKAMGGDYSVENLRLRCRAHNQRHAIDTYGLAKMRRYVKEPTARYTA